MLTQCGAARTGGPCVSLTPPPLHLQRPKPSSLSSSTTAHLPSKASFTPALVAAAASRKENVWSVDNDLAEAEAEVKTKRAARRRRGRGRASPRRGHGGAVLVSGAMLMEVETVLQTQEPVIKPAWDAFASSISGIWKGIGAVFSPITAEMEPIGIGTQDENLYDCYTLSYIENSPIGTAESKLKRKTKRVLLNPYGEKKQGLKDDGRLQNREKAGTLTFEHGLQLPTYGAFDFVQSDLEEDVISSEPGLAFFEDGSYSQGPIAIPVGEYDESKYYLSPTFTFEQCLVKGCHKRLRIVHTIEFNEGGANIQIMRVAIFEEQWVGPADVDAESDEQFEIKPFSQRRRSQPRELAGSWKVLEVSATPILAEEENSANGGAPFVYLCAETLKNRSLPESSEFFGEEEVLDMQDVTMLWLPGGVTGYVGVGKDGVLCIGVGWYSDEGVNLVMERDYGTDGKLKEVRWKSEAKRRWNE